MRVGSGGAAISRMLRGRATRRRIRRSRWGWAIRLARMGRRVAVTGLGAITPLGNDAQSTWAAAVAGRSGIDWIRAFDPSAYPVRIAGEVKDFDGESVAPAKELRR